MSYESILSKRNQYYHVWCAERKLYFETNGCIVLLDFNLHLFICGGISFRYSHIGVPMNHSKQPRAIFLIFTLTLLVSNMDVASIASAKDEIPIILRVTSSGTTGPCGDSWATACSLQTALAITSTSYGIEVWVAAGVYKPTNSTTDRDATFLLGGYGGNPVFYGGFDGMEDKVLSDRNPQAHRSILSGDIDNNDSQTPIITDLTSITGNTSNSYNVVTTRNSAVVLDGFTITAGNADGMSCPGTGCGGGLHNRNSNLVVNNVTFSGNLARIGGGGMFNYNSNPEMTLVTFNNNSAGWGGGMYNGNSNITIRNANFIGNSATGNGGGICNVSDSFSSDSSPIITNTTFSENSAYSGGGIYNSNIGSPTIINVTFSDNSASYGGGMFNYHSNTSINNTTFSNNWGSTGGAMYNDDQSQPFINNSIFWGNSAWQEAEIYNFNSSPTLSNSVVENGYDGTNIITSDPLLGPLGNYGGFTQTIPIFPGSSATDNADPVTCPSTDQRGISRPQGTGCDIGAYEARFYSIFLPLVRR
jgi:predicted outer membrane repeat protein